MPVVSQESEEHWFKMPSGARPDSDSAGPSAIAEAPAGASPPRSPKRSGLGAPSSPLMLPVSLVKTAREVTRKRRLSRRPSVMAIAAVQNDADLSYSAPASSSFESLNYDEAESETIRGKLAMPEPERRKLRRYEVMAEWAMVLLIGFLVGSVASLGTVAVAQLTTWKFDVVTAAVARGSFVEGWALISAYAVVLALAASLLTYWAPEAAGSGIPHVKAYLNGNRLDGALRPRTLVAKVVGICCCVAAGIPAGREGPMVHSGAIIANLWMRVNFHNDFDRRNFVSMGAAAGVAAAFHAPIGGILFSLEEVSSFWDPELTLRTFFMVMISSFTVAVWTESTISTGIFHDLGIVLFDNANDLRSREGVHGRSLAEGVQGRSPFLVWEVLIFIVMAIVMGAAGAAFNGLNRKVTIQRKRLSRKFRVLEAVVSIWLLISAFYGVSFAFACRDVDDSHGGTFEGVDLQDAHAVHLVEWQCANVSSAGRRLSGGDDGEGPSSFNDMATLLMQTQEGAIKQLFSRGTPGYFLPSTCGLFLLLYFCATVLIYGTYVPSGLFIPCMLIGGSFGRLCGESIHLIGGAASAVDPGLYALVGAAGMLGGVTRMTMSLAVIVLEISNDIDLMLPIMLSVGIAKQVGDMFNVSLYDMHIKLQGVPMIRDFLEAVTSEQQQKLNAKSVMSTNVVCVSDAETPARLAQLLRSTTHNGFPVVTQDHSGERRLFAGIISRQKIVQLLEYGPSEAALLGSRLQAHDQRNSNSYSRHSSVDLTSTTAGLASPNNSVHGAPAAASSVAPSLLLDPCPPANKGRAMFVEHEREKAMRRSRSRDDVTDMRRSASKEDVTTQPYAVDTSGSGGSSAPPLRSPAAASCSGSGRLRLNFAGGLGALGKGSRSASPEASPVDRANTAPTANGKQRVSGGGSEAEGQPSGTSGSGRLRRNFSGTLLDRLGGRSPTVEAAPAGAESARAATSGSGHGRTFFEPAASGEPAPRSPSPGPTGQVLDLRPHCDRSPYVVNELLPLRRVFRLFSTMGLRHLPVVDAHSLVVGMITRKDFLKVDAKRMARLTSRRRRETTDRYRYEGAREIERIADNGSADSRFSKRRRSGETVGEQTGMVEPPSPGTFKHKLKRNLTAGASRFNAALARRNSMPAGGLQRARSAGDRPSSPGRSWLGRSPSRSKSPEGHSPTSKSRNSPPGPPGSRSDPLPATRAVPPSPLMQPMPPPAMEMPPPVMDE